MILLTGASGFIGRQLLEGLMQEHGGEQVIALTSQAMEGRPYLLHNDYHFDNDYFVRSGYAGIHTIIHAGAFTPKNAAQANNWVACNQNIFTTEKLLKAELPHLRKIIYLSTVDVYGNEEVISETSLTDPGSLYGYSKVYSERMVTAYAKEKNIVSRILRVGHVYGPGEEAYQKIIPATIRKLLTDQPLEIWGTGNELRCFIYIRDIVKAILQSTRTDQFPDIVNLVGGRTITVRELIDKLVKINGLQTEVKIVPSTVPSRNVVFDNKRMKEYLLSEETALDAGLQMEFDYMKQLKQ